jgi:hypothetical protein
MLARDRDLANKERKVFFSDKRVSSENFTLTLTLTLTLTPTLTLTLTSLIRWDYLYPSES